MEIIGMPEAARRTNFTPDGIRRSLKNAGVKLIQINQKAVAVDADDLAAYILARNGYSGRGRPRLDTTEGC